MFERFSERAKQVMLLADQAAVRGGSDTIDTEHLLWGLLKDDAGVGSTILHELGVDFPAVRRELDKHLPRSAADSEPQRITQSEHVKRVIEHAVAEAREMNHPTVGTEHLLLGMLRDNEGVAQRILSDFGLQVEKVRERVRILLDES